MTAMPDRSWRPAIAHLDCLAIEIIKRSDARRFVILPRRWVVERTIASSEAWLAIASIRRMTRHLAKFELWVGL